MLNVGGQQIVAPVPVVAGQANALFADLCAKFNIAAEVACFLVNDAGLETLDDFRHFFTAPEQVETKVTSQIQNLAKPGLQAARLRTAWGAVKSASADAVETKKRGNESTDFDTLLDMSS